MTSPLHRLNDALICKDNRKKTENLLIIHNSIPCRHVINEVCTAALFWILDY